MQGDYCFRSWVSVDTYEMVLISLIVVVFLAGIVGNSLVFIAVTTTRSMQVVRLSKRAAVNLLRGTIT